MLHVWGKKKTTKGKKIPKTISHTFPPGGENIWTFRSLKGRSVPLLCSPCVQEKKKNKKRPPLESEGSTRFSTHLITVLTWFSLINDNHQMPSCGRMTSGSLADTPGNSVNDFGDGSGCVMLLSLLSGLHYPLQYLFTLSSHSLPILILWNLDTFIQICPMPFMALTCQAFNIFPSAPVHF